MSRFYKLSWVDANEGKRLAWAETKKVANVLKRHVLSQYRNRPKDYISPVKIEEVDIPTDKMGLAKWLDRNLNREKG
jgi:hypothetical protein